MEGCKRCKTGRRREERRKRREEYRRGEEERVEESKEMERRGWAGYKITKQWRERENREGLQGDEAGREKEGEELGRKDEG